MEMWDVLDVNRNKTGRMICRENKNELGEGEFHLVVHACIFNSKNEMLIQKRQKVKKSFPNMWDITVGGSALAGENSQVAIARELQEELGIEYDFSKLRPNLSVNFSRGFDDVYIIEKDVDINDIVMQEEEVQDAKWATKEEILDLIDNKEFLPYPKEYINIFFSINNNDGLLIKE